MNTLEELKKDADDFAEAISKSDTGFGGYLAMDKAAKSAFAHFLYQFTCGQIPELGKQYLEELANPTRTK